MKRCVPVIVITLLSAAVASCAGFGPPTGPLLSGQTQPDLQSRTVWGVWELHVDFSGFTAIPFENRTVDGHFNVKPFLKPPKCSNCIKFSNVYNDTANKVISADVTLRNPTSLEGADVRGIVISNNPAVYLANPDDYTPLFDPDNPPDINPFRLFGKTNPNGIVGSEMEVTEHFEVAYDVMPFVILTVVDAVYPANSKREPYAIKNQKVDGNLDVNATVARLIEVDVLDRHNDIGTVSVVSQELGLNFALTPDPDKKGHYYGWLSNANKKPAGDYRLTIMASDQATPWVLYDYLTVKVVTSLGEWSKSQYTFVNQGCSRDIAAGMDMLTGNSCFFSSGSTGCKEIRLTTSDFSSTSTYFKLVNISQHVPDFSPYPVKRIDASFTGGIAFCTSSEATYSDPWYTGPMSSLLITIFPDGSFKPKYVDPGDGDSGRMVPTDSSLVVVDVTDDMAGSLYGLWADPEGEGTPEMYGLSPDYTRHDVFAGGPLPASLVGEGPGKVSRNASKIKGFDVSSLGIDSGVLYILESDGTSSEIEVVRFIVDFLTKKTTYSLSKTVPLGSVAAVDIDMAMYNPLYLPNPNGDSLMVLIAGPSGGYINVLEMTNYSLVDHMGDASNPSITGTPVSLDVDSAMWRVVVLDEQDKAYVFSWVL